MTLPLPNGAQVQVAPAQVPVLAAPAAAPSPLIVIPVVGTRGPTGAAGDGAFTYTQSSPAATWTITNTLGRYPSAVTVVVGDEIVDADIETPDTSTIVITFASPQSGRAEII